jgi:DNA primase catalytic core
MSTADDVRAASLLIELCEDYNCQRARSSGYCAFAAGLTRVPRPCSSCPHHFLCVTQRLAARAPRRAAIRSTAAKSPGPQRRPRPERARRSPGLDAARRVADGGESIYEQVVAAVPLSAVFREMLGDNALKAGSAPGSYVVVCPFHDDKNPSLSLSDTNKVYHCFGCQASGNVFTLEMRWRGLQTVKEVIASLATRYPEVERIMSDSKTSGDGGGTVTPRSAVSSSSVYTPPVQHWRPPPKLQPRAWGEPLRARREALRILALAQEYFVRQLGESDAARRYLSGRGVSEVVAQEVGIGYAPGEGMTECLRMLVDAGFSEEACVDAGVAKRNANGRVYDVFRDRLMLPIRNTGGEIVSFAGRLLGKSGTAPKYINGASTIVFQKKGSLYGADLVLTAKETSARLEYGMLILVEGYMDVVAIHGKSGGKIAAVASMGTAISEEQVKAALELLGDRVDGKLIINLDGDDAGEAAAVRLCESVLPAMTEVNCVYIAQPPKFVKDVGEFLERGEEDSTAEAYAKYLEENALTWIEWRVHRIFKAVLALQETKQSAAKVAQAAALGALGDGADDEDYEGPGGSVGQSSFVSEKIRQQTMLLLNSMSGEDACQESDEGGHAATAGGRMSAKERQRKRAATLASASSPRDGDEEGTSESSIGGCPIAVLDEVGVFMSKALRVSPGLNLPWLVHRWADMLSAGSTKRVPILYDAIMTYIDRHAAVWERKSPARLIDLMPTPPWVLAELPKSSRRVRGKVDHVLGTEYGGTQCDIAEYLQDKRRLKATLERLQIEEKVLIPEIERRRSESSRRLQSRPRASAEEIILRTLIWANEDDRLDAMDALLEVMMEVEEAGLFPFWTSASRASLLQYLVDADGALTVQEMAAECEPKEWWRFDIELLFVDVEDFGDEELKTIRMIELSLPVVTVRQAATAVKEMTRKVATGRAVDKLGDFMQAQLHEGSESNDMERPPTTDEIKDLIDGVSGIAFKTEQERKDMAEAALQVEAELRQAQAVNEMREKLTRNEYVDMDPRRPNK